MVPLDVENREDIYFPALYTAIELFLFCQMVLLHYLEKLMVRSARKTNKSRVQIFSLRKHEKVQKN
jgi:hypothetical protein